MKKSFSALKVPLYLIYEWEVIFCIKGSPVPNILKGLNTICEYAMLGLAVLYMLYKYSTTEGYPNPLSTEPHYAA